MLGMAPDYDHLTVIQKVEVFEHAMDSTSGEQGGGAGGAGCEWWWGAWQGVHGSAGAS